MPENGSDQREIADRALTLRRALAPPPQPLAYTLPGAVKATGIARHTLYALMRSGELSYARIGGRRQILVDDLRALLARHQVAAR